jgi:hypothetical protein
MLARITRLATVAVFLVLAAVAWQAYDMFFNEETSDSSSRSTESSGSEAYSDLEIFEDPNGHFAGRVTIHNKTTQDHWVMVSVNIYNGEQNVGELLGDVTLKPGTESVLELSGYDDFTEFTDSRVNLTGFPG